MIRHRIEVARAYSAWNCRDEALTVLLDGERDAREQILYHFISRQLVLSRKRGTPSYHLAGWQRLHVISKRLPIRVFVVTDEPLNRSRPYLAAGILFFDHAGWILLVEPTYKDHWDLPGGYVESGETPAQAAAREVREELGIDVAVGPLLVADWAPLPDEGDKLLFIFDGGTLTDGQLGAIRLQAEEIASYAFHNPTEAIASLIPRLGRRVAAAIDAHHAGRATYLEFGIPHIR